jgi:histidinol-phosphate aminotransferase
MSGLAVRPGIMEITPYVGGESDVAGVERVIKLASNEGALGPSPKAVAAYRDAAASLHRYPDGASADLRQALGRHHGLDARRIVCGAGSDELIALLCRAYAGPGDEVLHSAHGFLMYSIAARAVGATPVAAPETDLTADVDALIGKVTAKTRIVFLANPNNPTGTVLPAAAVARLRAGLPGSILLVIDAAYAEYAMRDDYEPGGDLVDGGDNVVMTRTFSKMYALGGVRLGWAYCPPSVADVLERARNPFNVSAPAQLAGVAALADTAFAERSRRHNDTWLAWTTERLRGLGLVVPPSAGNFILARFPSAAGRDAEAADAFLKRHGIITRRVAAYGLADSLRITIGREDEMRAVADTLSDFLG